MEIRIRWRCQDWNFIRAKRILHESVRSDHKRSLLLRLAHCGVSHYIASSCPRGRRCRTDEGASEVQVNFNIDRLTLIPFKPYTRERQSEWASNLSKSLADWHWVCMLNPTHFDHNRGYLRIWRSFSRNNVDSRSFTTEFQAGEIKKPSLKDMDRFKLA